MITLPKVLPAPKRPLHLAKSAKWLSGEGAGSWFLIEGLEGKKNYVISRFSPEGKSECKGTFFSKTRFDLGKDYSFTYPSHCLKVSIKQNDKIILLKNIDCSLSNEQVK